MVSHNATSIAGIAVEYRLASRMVVFSHGFGTQRGSRGMFTDIVAALPEGYGYVLFDYNDVYGTEVKLTDFTEQVRRLRSIIAWVQKQQNVTDVHILAHSMGCIVVALAKPDINGKVILLASPTSIGARTREYFTSKRGAKVDGDNWVVPRQDGTRTIIPLSFFDEFESVNVK